MKQPPIILCEEWGARHPKAAPVIVPRAVRMIQHHTAGHVAQLGNPTVTTKWEAEGYARAIQTYHMDDNGWNDSGHNFLICRAGFILEGRHLTVASIKAGHMVESAHCPGQNGQVGVELEHYGKENMTAAQVDSFVDLSAWIAFVYKDRHVLPIHPHNEYSATTCPANLEAKIPALTHLANEALQHARTAI